MKVKDRDRDVLVSRAELILEGHHEVDKLRRVLELYGERDRDETSLLVIPIPFPGDVPKQP